ncbi:pyrimidine 5'-nucleotidase (macronuclear) [Tetrahymena thermophila SB210]|uniref:5'-nucleotidase n=1 Tax=Tetrahymena thermophila (strain SB210) TaxID=312017 RepID=I7M7B0_TETTS|nr:pyrimidine 5'-nucleotidase [Tetrahymena thermophila SB210]EAR90891.1 pyrimidine 5'-nucleotidase [Tetrahymena thermophila SB210]|eukprot:XP_001011136.1 pyrimidine 5'-nucleotidase [Tetrahymena thermophila SB210]
MNIIPDLEVTPFYTKKRILIHGGIALAVLAIIKFKKYLKKYIPVGIASENQPFNSVNQHKKLTHESCGTWKDIRHNSFDSNEQIIISNPDKLRQKLQKMKKAGLKELQICSDFDQTITAFGTKEKPQMATLGMIRQSQHVSTQFRDNLKQLFTKYHPYESDSQLDKKQKAAYMQEWNDGVSENFCKEQLTKDKLLSILEESTLAFRYNFKEFLISLSNVNLPFYIISGGISAILQTMLNSILDTQKDYSNFFLFSNQARFDEQNILTELKMVINTILKDEQVNQKEFKLRKNTLLFGDYHHDIYMSNQLGSENTVSILFLRDNLVNDIPNLQKDWDIIVRGDGSYILHQAITQYIAGSEWCDLKLSEQAEQEFNSNPIYDEIKKLFD